MNKLFTKCLLNLIPVTFLVFKNYYFDTLFNGLENVKVSSATKAFLLIDALGITFVRTSFENSCFMVCEASKNCSNLNNNKN